MSETIEGDALLHAAATGDRDAQAKLVDYALSCGATGAVPAPSAAIMAEVFARLAAAHGDPDDSRILAGVLFLCAEQSHLMGQPEASREYQVEGLALAEQVAASGNENVSRLVLIAADLLDGDVVRDAAAAVRFSDHKTVH